jgi:N-dimethylarginine dimethylaminohydrolase
VQSASRERKNRDNGLGMGATYLMSYPGPTWQIRGGENFRSQERSGTSPRRALAEWLRLCDGITQAGGHILVMPPAEVTPPLTGMMYTANAGALFKSGDQHTFLLSKMSVAHRQGERDLIRRFMADAGLPVAESSHVWEGQADVCTLPGNRFVLTFGVRTVREALAEVRARLPAGARVLEVKLRQPYFHGDTCLNPLTTRGGDTVLLAHGGALVDTTLVELQRFVGDAAEVFAVEEADALGYACNALGVAGTVLLPAGLSTGLRGQLARRGLQLEELELGELFGKGGGGPRCLVNELRGFVLTPEAPDYTTRRPAIASLVDRYPEAAPTA